jgi:four helix bundle protein
LRFSIEEEDIMTEGDMLKRTRQFALRVMRLADSLPRTRSGYVVGSQIIRSGTSVGANYRSACRGRSRAEFISKLGIVEEEADETAYWLELIIDAGLLKPELVTPLHREATELVAITVASRRTAARARTIENRKSKIEN